MTVRFAADTMECVTMIHCRYDRLLVLAGTLVTDMDFCARQLLFGGMKTYVSAGKKAHARDASAAKESVCKLTHIMLQATIHKMARQAPTSPPRPPLRKQAHGHRAYLGHSIQTLG